MKPVKTSVSITIDNPVLAELEDRSLSSYINLVLREHLKQLDRKTAENR